MDEGGARGDRTPSGLPYAPPVGSVRSEAPDRGRAGERRWVLTAVAVVTATLLLAAGLVVAVAVVVDRTDGNEVLLTGLPADDRFGLVAVDGLNDLRGTGVRPDPVVSGTPRPVRVWDPPHRTDGEDEGSLAVRAGGRLVVSVSDEDGTRIGLVDGDEFGELYASDGPLRVWHLVASDRFLVDDAVEGTCTIVEASGAVEELAEGRCQPVGPSHVAVIDAADVSDVVVHDLEGVAVADYTTGVRGVPSFSADGTILFVADPAGDEVRFVDARTGDELARLDTVGVLATAVVGGTTPAVLTVRAADDDDDGPSLVRTDLRSGVSETVAHLGQSSDPVAGLAVGSGREPRLLVWTESRTDGLRVWSGEQAGATVGDDLVPVVEVGDYRLAAASVHRRTGDLYLTIAPGIDLGGRSTELHLVSATTGATVVVDGDWEAVDLLEASADGSTVVVDAQPRGDDDDDRRELDAITDGAIVALDRGAVFGPVFLGDGTAVYTATSGRGDAEIRRVDLAGARAPEALAEERALLVDLTAQDLLAPLSLGSGPQVFGDSPEPCLESDVVVLLPGDEADGEATDAGFPFCITLPVGGEVDLRVDGEVDTTLTIEDAQGEEVAYSDDELGLDPAYRGELDAGTYLVTVASFDGWERGDVTVSFDVD